MTSADTYEYDIFNSMKKLAFGAASALAFLSSASSVFALAETINLGNVQNRGIGANTALELIFKNVVTIIFTVAAILVLAMLIWGGVEWVLSGGDKEKVGNARKRIINSLIGLLIIGIAFVIVNVVGQIVGFNILTQLALPNLNQQQ